MVKHKDFAKTSSDKEPEMYVYRCFIRPASLVPMNVNVSIGSVSEKYIVACDTQYLRESWWLEPPHLVFANLLVHDHKAVETFTSRYGMLTFSYHRQKMKHFSIDERQVSYLQKRLRRGWLNLSKREKLGPNSYSDIAKLVKRSFEIVVFCRTLLLRPKDLWTSICFLLLWDSEKGKLGYCQNPDCPAPYFRKTRESQKFCEAGPCVVYAQRQYSLKWWNRVGKNRRREKHAKRRDKRKTSK